MSSSFTDKTFWIKAFWVFMFGCIFGTFYEMINHYIHFGYLTSRSGLLYGPFNPVYGIGALIFMFITVCVKSNTKIFIYGSIAGGLTEYLISFFQEIIFGTISWDYSNHFLNINGRTTIPFMLFWGLLALIFAIFIYPNVSKLVDKFSKKPGRIITYCVMAFMIFNCFISAAACIREAERVNGIEAKNNIDVFLDKHYPSELINKVYTNSQRVG